MTTRDDDSAGWRSDLALLALLALAFRMVFLALLDPVIDAPDAVLYLEAAGQLRDGQLWQVDPKLPLLYPALTALAGLAIEDLEAAARTVSFIAALLTLVPLYALARRLHGRRAAQYGGLAVALWPWLADYACRVSTEALACLLWFAGAELLLRGLHRRGPALAGALAAYTGLMLARPEGLFVFLAAIAAGLIVAWNRSAALRRLAAFAAAAAAVIAANTLFTRLQTGALTPSYRAGFLAGEFDAPRFAQAFATAFGDLVPVMLGPVLLVFLGAGLFLPRPWRDLRAELFVLALFVPHWAAAIAVLSPAPRYFMAPLMAMALWPAAGMALAAARVPPHLRAAPLLRALPAAALVLSMAMGAAITLGAEHAGRMPRQPREYKAAGVWMRDHLAPGLVFTRKPQIAFYAGMPSTGPADGDTLEAALGRARSAGARYVAVDQRYAHPALAPLLDPARAPAGLRLAYDETPYPGARVVVYAIEPAPAEAAPPAAR